MNRIVVDVTGGWSSSTMSGIQRVTAGVVQGLLETTPPGTTEIVAHRLYRLRRLRIDPPKASFRSVALRARDVYFGLEPGIRTTAAHRRQLAAAKAAGARMAFFVHDLFPLRHPAWFSDSYRAAFADAMRCYLALADDLLVPSEATREALAGTWRAMQPSRDPPRIHVVRPSGDMPQARYWRRPGAATSRPAAAPPRAFCLMVGTIEPRKGHLLALQAFDALWRDGSDLGLVFAGRLGWAEATTRTALQATLAARPGRFLWVDTPPDDELLRLYRASRGILVASLDEGFCLPVAEAISHGRKVLCRDFPAAREFASASVSLFPADVGPTDLAARIRQWNQDEHPVPTPAPYTWKDASRRAADILLDTSDFNHGN